MSKPADIKRRLLTTDEAAAYLGVGRRTMQYLLRDGEVVKVRIGNSTRVDLADLDEYVERLKAKA